MIVSHIHNQFLAQVEYELENGKAINYEADVIIHEDIADCVIGVSNDMYIYTSSFQLNIDFEFKEYHMVSFLNNIIFLYERGNAFVPKRDWFMYFPIEKDGKIKANETISMAYRIINFDQDIGVVKTSLNDRIIVIKSCQIHESSESVIYKPGKPIQRIDDLMFDVIKLIREHIDNGHEYPCFDELVFSSKEKFLDFLKKSIN